MGCSRLQEWHQTEFVRYRSRIRKIFFRHPKESHTDKSGRSEAGSLGISLNASLTRQPIKPLCQSVLLSKFTVDVFLMSLHFIKLSRSSCHLTTLPSQCFFTHETFFLYCIQLIGVLRSQFLHLNFMFEDTNGRRPTERHVFTNLSCKIF